ncbi:MAG: UDP-N-acetylglucosamine 1-carboxyvinyltransferase [Eggerthellaceae bacterium]|nr:UDP-N-acetylglucosamine 1-carboxyvinyltransferase [Eggerthellaceae bacterium]
MAEEIIVARESAHVSGTVQVSGAKNSALKLIAAAILGQGASTIRNVPHITDIDIMIEVLESLGAHVEREEDVVVVDTTDVDKYVTPYELVSKMRASISVLGPLIGRFGRARVAMPGGCKIGARKIDMHLRVLEDLGVEFSNDHGYLNASSPHGLKAADVFLEFPSVGATENMMMASVTVPGTTIIDNAAREPEIVDLANMLNEMGAHIEGAGSPTITITGVSLDEMHPCDHTTVGDRIEAGTFLTAGALLGGPVTVEGIDPSFLRMAILKLQEMDCDVTTTETSITVARTNPLRAADIQTLPHPGFPTDLQAQFLLLNALAEGNSVISENIFENRFMFASELIRMGADVTIDAHHALIQGVDQLQGAPVSSPDLRGGAALVIAGLAAEGETEIHDIYHIDRGYEDYVGKLQSLGADVERVTR